jgi:hypothetical protein
MKNGFLAGLIAAAIALPVVAATARPVTTYASGPVGYVCSIEIEIGTGGDDLRGGNDSVDGWILMPFGTSGPPTWLSLNDMINSDGLNGRRNWANWSSHTMVARLPDCSIRSDSIHGIRLQIRSIAGISTDNWNLQSIAVRWSGSAYPPGPGLTLPASGEFFRSYEPRRESYLFRFTGDRPFKEFDW